MVSEAISKPPIVKIYSEGTCPQTSPPPRFCVIMHMFIFSLPNVKCIFCHCCFAPLSLFSPSLYFHSFQFLLAPIKNHPVQKGNNMCSLLCEDWKSLCPFGNTNCHSYWLGAQLSQSQPYSETGIGCRDGAGLSNFILSIDTLHSVSP